MDECQECQTEYLWRVYVDHQRSVEYFECINGHTFHRDAKGES